MRILITNEKGGVAKTTTAAAIAVGLANMYDWRVLVVDLDSQGHAATALGVSPEAGLSNYLFTDLVGARQVIRHTPQSHRVDIVPSNMETLGLVAFLNNNRSDEWIRGRIGDLCQTYHIAIFDAPTSAGRLRQVAMNMADLILIPAQPEKLGMGKIAEVIAAMRPEQQYIIVPVMYDSRISIHRQGLKYIQMTFAGVAAPIPLRTKVKEASACGKSIWRYAIENRDGDGNDPFATIAYGELVTQIHNCALKEIE